MNQDNNPLERVRELEGTLHEKDREIRYLKQLLVAYEKLERLSKEELKEADEQVKVHERISEYSEKELKLRDVALRNILEVNRKISAVLDPKTLLSLVLDAVINTLKAFRGVLFLNDSEKGIIPSIFKNITPEDVKKEDFRFSRAQVFEAALSRKSILKIMEDIQTPGGEITLSCIALPLIYEKDLVGVLYVDIVSKTKTFRVQDLDLAELFASQAAISINNASLYDKIRNQNLELMKLVNLKTQLLSEVSNKMKEPLDQLIQLMKKVQENSDFSDQVLDQMLRLGQKVQNTVTKVLAIQEMEKEVEDLFSQKVDLNEVFKNIFEAHRQEIEKKQVEIDIHLSPEFDSYRSNASIMRMIFDELLTNAVFYNKQGGKVKIRGYRKADFLYVEIEDTGYGIRMQDRDRIFERFARTDNSAELNERGAGLGLFLARKFAHHYNGEIEVESEIGKGSKFTVRLMIN